MILRAVLAWRRLVSGLLKKSQVLQSLVSFFCEAAVLFFLVFLYGVQSFFPSHGHVSKDIHTELVGHNYLIYVLTKTLVYRTTISCTSMRIKGQV